jgi:hypothetical protein
VERYELAGNDQSQSCSRHVSGITGPKERVEQLSGLIGWYANAIVADVYHELIRVENDAQIGVMNRKLERIGQ